MKARRNSNLAFRCLQLDFDVMDNPILVDPTEGVDGKRMLVRIAFGNTVIAESM
jgi:hypothetical protein